VGGGLIRDAVGARRVRPRSHRRAGVRSGVVDVYLIVEALVRRTQQVFADAQGSERHARLCQRLERLYGAWELARLLDQGALARWIETHIDAVRRTSTPIEARCDGSLARSRLRRAGGMISGDCVMVGHTQL
jgi:hypothetical protein